MKFVLKQYDTELISFDLRSEGVDGFVCTILKKSEKNRRLFPLGLDLTDKGLLDWLKSRVIPRNREFVDKILSVYGLDHNNILGIVKLCMGLSVNDSYWIVPEGFEGKFKDYNLFENGFDKALSLIAWTGFGSVRPSAFSSSPEFTTNGNLRKGWRRINGKILLYKGGSSGAANTGNEPYSEFYASQIAEAMGIAHVSYKLAKWKSTLCSTCELFTDIDHSFVPIHSCFPEKKLSEVAAELKKMGDKFYQPFCDMMVFDALVCNTDRHFGNFGLLVNNRSNKPCAFAPIFDNGMALFPFAMEDDFRDLDAYAKTRTPYFGSSFAELAAAFMTDRQRKQLRKLIDFRFTRDRNYNLPAKRLKALEGFLQRRIRKLSAGENKQLQPPKVLSENQTVSNSQVQTSSNKKAPIMIDKQAEENEKIKNLVLALKKQPREHWAFKGVKREHAHAFIKYPAMMVPQMQSEIIEAFIQQFPEIKSVYDPFVGSGTVMTEAMLHGLAFAGQDINPLAILACYVKKGPFYTEKIKKSIDLLRKRISEDHDSDIEVVFKKRDKWFTKEILIELSRIRRAIMKEQSKRVRCFFWLAMVDTVRATSNSRTNTFKLHIRTQEDIASRKISPILVFLREVNDNFTRIQEFRSVLNTKELLNRSSYIRRVNIKCKNIIRGGIHHKQQLFDLLVSSPPYGDNGTTVPYGQYSFLPLQWIAPCDIPSRAPFNYLITAQEIDRQSLGGRCRNKDIVLQSMKTKSQTLKFVLEQLYDDKQRRQYKVASFFYDMNLALKKIISQMADGAFMVFTLGNRRVANKIIPMNVIMRELLEAHGALFITEIYRDIPTKRMAAKNRSSATMTEESLLIMRKKKNKDDKKEN